MATLRRILRLARAHGYSATIVGDVVVIGDDDGAVNVTTLDAALAWMGY